MHGWIIAHTYRNIVDGPLREVFGFDVYNSPGEVGRHFCDSRFGNHHVVDQIRGKNIDLKAVSVGIKTRYFNRIKHSIGVAVAQSAHIHIFTSLYGNARNLGKCLSRIRNTGFPEAFG